MKKPILILISLSAILFFLPNISKLKLDHKLIFTSMDKIPVLPSTPFDYSLRKAFNQTLLSNSHSGGYEVEVPEDTTVLPIISDHAATLGRVLFYDQKLSATENISCATCHDNAKSFTENKPFSDGIAGLTKRNSMALNDLGWTNNLGFSWSMKEESLFEMIKLPLVDENEIGADIDELIIKLENTSYYPDLFSKAFGDAEVTESRIIEALRDFIFSINSFKSEFDQASGENFMAFTNNERIGAAIFREDCATCHVQGKHERFSNTVEETFTSFPEFFNNGLPNTEADLGAGEWDDRFKFLYKIPSLRNVELTSPYMHDGRFETLEEVIEHYSEGVVQTNWTHEFNTELPVGGKRYNQTEKIQLLAFLTTLTDHTMAHNPKWQDPFTAVTSAQDPDLIIQGVQIKPNPMNDFSIIEIDNPNNHEVQVEMFNSNGQLLRSLEFQGTQLEINNQTFEGGTYFIHLIMNNKKVVKKLIVL